MKMPTKEIFNFPEPVKVPEVPLDWASYYFGSYLDKIYDKK